MIVIHEKLRPLCSIKLKVRSVLFTLKFLITTNFLLGKMQKNQFTFTAQDIDSNESFG